MKAKKPVKKKSLKVSTRFSTDVEKMIYATVFGIEYTAICHREMAMSAIFTPIEERASHCNAIATNAVDCYRSRSKRGS